MAFREEIDALRERAQNAETQLASQTERIGRVAEIESQLEDARRQIREAKLGSSGAIGRAAPWLLVGLVAGAGLVYAWSSSQLAALRTQLDVEGARAAGERRVVEARAESSADAASRAGAERDTADAARLRTADDLVALVRVLASATGGVSPMSEAVVPLGRVSFSASAAHPVGTACEVAAASSFADCSAEIRCGAPLIGLGCATPRGTRLTSAGSYVTVDTGASGDVVIACADVPPTGVVTTPYGVRPLGMPGLPTAEEIEAMRARRGR